MPAQIVLDAPEQCRRRWLRNAKQIAFVIGTGGSWTATTDAGDLVGFLVKAPVGWRAYDHLGRPLGPVADKFRQAEDRLLEGSGDWPDRLQAPGSPELPAYVWD